MTDGQGDDLDGRVAVVTGAAHGLGRAYARHLAACGAVVAVFDLDEDAAATMAGELTDAGHEASAHRVDVADAATVGPAVDAVTRRWGRIDALVNNAGGALLRTAPFETFDEQQWQHVLGVNLMGPVHCSAAVVPVMRAGGGGAIVNVSSASLALARPVGLAPYLAAKGGVVGLTRALARELGPDGIRVNAVAPGYVPVDTPKEVHSPEAAQRLRDRMIDEQCLRRTETPEDLCGAVAFLCGAGSRFVTGQVLTVDGGWTHG